MGSPLPPSCVAVLTTAAAHEHRYHRCSPDDDYHEDDDFEFTPLLHRPRRLRRIVNNARTTERRPRTAPQQQVRWHDMAFGSVRVPAAMDMGEIRRRLSARARQQQQALAAGGGGGAGAGAGNERQPSPSAAAAAGWAPWRLIRSLSCKGVEAVAAAAAPVRLV